MKGREVGEAHTQTTAGNLLVGAGFLTGGHHLPDHPDL